MPSLSSRSMGSPILKRSNACRGGWLRWGQKSSLAITKWGWSVVGGSSLETEVPRFLKEAEIRFLSMVITNLIISAGSELCSCYSPLHKYHPMSSLTFQAPFPLYFFLLTPSMLGSWFSYCTLNAYILTFVASFRSASQESILYLQQLCCIPVGFFDLLPQPLDAKTDGRDPSLGSEEKLFPLAP